MEHLSQENFDRMMRLGKAVDGISALLRKSGVFRSETPSTVHVVAPTLSAVVAIEGRAPLTFDAVKDGRETPIVEAYIDPSKDTARLSVGFDNAPRVAVPVLLT